MGMSTSSTQPTRHAQQTQSTHNDQEACHDKMGKKGNPDLQNTAVEKPHSKSTEQQSALPNSDLTHDKSAKSDADAAFKQAHGDAHGKNGPDAQKDLDKFFTDKKSSMDKSQQAEYKKDGKDKSAIKETDQKWNKQWKAYNKEDTDANKELRKDLGLPQADSQTANKTKVDPKHEKHANKHAAGTPTKTDPSTETH